MRIVCVSDTHNRHREVQVPEGDLLIHAGDATLRGTPAEIEGFDAWLESLPHPHKVVIAGNHDWGFEQTPELARGLLRAATYLEDGETEVGGLRIWGAPWQPWYHDWAFQRPRGAPMREVWERIPEGIDVLVTHGPPYGILDRTHRGVHAGCEELREAVRRIRPRLHVFGHIHEAWGEEEVDGTRFVNACACTIAYVPTQPPIVIELGPGGAP